MTETWKDVVGYEGLYEVSNLGNVRSLNWRGTRCARMLCKRPNNYGYLCVLLSSKNVSKKLTVHRLVASAFLDNPSEFSDVNHIDEDKTNNSVWNLEWCSHADNVLKYRSNHPDHGKHRRRKRKGL